jgi:hypothetical protein
MFVFHLTSGALRWAMRYLDLLGLPIYLQIVIAQPVVVKNHVLLA